MPGSQAGRLAVRHARRQVGRQAKSGNPGMRAEDCAWKQARKSLETCQPGRIPVFNADRIQVQLHTPPHSPPSVPLFLARWVAFMLKRHSN
eukprot:jgi/Mesvir1/28041/Mv26196-RA.1